MSDELTEGGGPSDEWGHQLAWWLALHAGHAGTGRRIAATSRRQGTNALRQRHGVRRRLDLQLLGQARAAGGVDLQGGARLAARQVHAHEALIRLLRQRIEL